MRSDTIYNYLLNQYEEKERSFNKLMSFVEQNKDYPEHHWIKHLNSILASRETWREKIFTLFVETINAAGGNNLRYNGESCKQFYQLIESSPFDSPTVKTSHFLSLFPDKVNNLNSLVNYLENNFRNFGQKKSALFLRDLDLLHRESDKIIFSDYDSANLNLIVPVDVVITKILNDFFDMPSNLELKAYRHFELINDFAKRSLNERYMLLEDLWFWGYYNQMKTNGVRKFQLNKDKFYSELYFYPDEAILDRLIKFNHLFKSLTN